MYQAIPYRRTTDRMAAPRTISAGLAVASGLGAVGLALTNPGPEQYQEFAGRRLVETITREICLADGMLLGLGMLLRNCPELVSSQQALLGRIALQNSSRTNFGLGSLYRTRLGGQRLFNTVTLPRYETVTLALAGQFLMISTGEDRR